MTTKLERIKAGFELLATNPQECYHSGCMEQLAKEGGPLLLAVVEAAAAFAFWDWGCKEQQDESVYDSWRRRKAALKAAIAPLMEVTE